MSAPMATTLLVRGAQRQVQEAERIEQRLRRLPEALDHLQRDLGRALALGVAAHAVAGDQQRRFIADDRARRGPGCSRARPTG